MDGWISCYFTEDRECFHFISMYQNTFFIVFLVVVLVVLFPLPIHINEETKRKCQKMLSYKI